MEPFPKLSLIASCGMNCSLCMAYQRKRNHCPGCRADEYKPVSRVRCKIKNCEVLVSQKFKFCHECKDFPCINLKKLDKRYRTKYHMSMVENLTNIQTIGISEFCSNEESRWTCRKCGGTICVHKHGCLCCGELINAGNILYHI